MAPFPEIVQVIKQESTALGGDDSDDGPELNYPINPFEDVIEAAGYDLQEPDGTVRDHDVRVSRLEGEMTFKDQVNPTPVTLSDLLAGEGGLTPTTHRPLDQLVHDLAETGYEEILYTGNKVTGIIDWTSAAKLIKVREVQVSYSGNQVTLIRTIQYDGTGAAVETLDEVPTYDAGKIIDITRTLT